MSIAIGGASRGRIPARARGLPDWRRSAEVDTSVYPIVSGLEVGECCWGVISIGASSLQIGKRELTRSSEVGIGASTCHKSTCKSAPRVHARPAATASLFHRCKSRARVIPRDGGRSERELSRAAGGDSIVVSSLQVESASSRATGDGDEREFTRDGCRHSTCHKCTLQVGSASSRAGGGPGSETPGRPGLLWSADGDRAGQRVKRESTLRVHAWSGDNC